MNKPALSYNPLDPTVHADPYPSYRMLQEQGDVVYNDIMKSWLVVGYDAVKQAFNNPHLSSQRVDALLARVPQCPLHTSERALGNLRSWILFEDPPDHSRLRNLVHLAFTPRLIEQLRPKVEELVDHLLAAQTGPEMDLIAALAGPLPVYVIADLLGIPRDDSELLKRCSDQIARLLAQARPTVDDAAEAGSALNELSDYFLELIEQKRAQPQDDLITRLVQTQEASEVLSDEEIVSTCTVLLFGGHETTTNLIGNGTFALIKNPTQWQELRRNPELIPLAVKELLRYDSPVQWLTRVTKEDVEIAGVTIPAKRPVMLMIGAANRDERIFERADRLEVTRKRGRSLSLGQGIHYCLGAALAQLEGEVALRALLRKYSLPVLARPSVNWRAEIGLRGLKELWIQDG
jgi:cytochrome P450